jgi:hypothetical protein
MTSGVKRGEPNFGHVLTPFACVIGRAGARQTRRLITRIAVDWGPSDVGPSGTCLGLGTRVSGSRFTPTRVVPYRGGASADRRFQPGCPLRARTSAMPCLRWEGNCPGHGPHQGNQFSRNRHHALVGVLAASYELSIPFTQADLRLPTEVLERFGPLFQAPLEMATDLGRVAGRPRAFNQGPAGMAMAGLGEASLGTPWATGICRGRQAQITHQRFGVGQAREVSSCGDGRDRPGELYTPQRLEGLHDWG